MKILIVEDDHRIAQPLAEDLRLFPENNLPSRRLNIDIPFR